MNLFRWTKAPLSQVFASLRNQSVGRNRFGPNNNMEITLVNIIPTFVSKIAAVSRAMLFPVLLLSGLFLSGCEHSPTDASAPQTPDVLAPQTPDVLANQEELAQVRGLYLQLMKTSLLDLIYETNPEARRKRDGGLDWPSRAMTMVGRKRLDNLQVLMEDVIANDIPGDFIEAGAWRGGSTIFMRAFLKAYGIEDRKVWVADSFEGLPPSDAENYPADEGWDFTQYSATLAVTLENVQRNFEVYGLLDDQVEFLKGWFKDTLPDAPVEQLALMRLDGDLYESTIQSFQYLYHKLSPGGWVIVDDYRCISLSAQATEDFRKERGITTEVIPIDFCGVYFQKPKNTTD